MVKKRKESLSSDKFNYLRELAENLREEYPVKDNYQSMDEVLHELEIHQIELEIENDELRSTQKKLEKKSNEYSNLYDFSPVGYLSFDKNGLIRNINLTGSKMLRKERNKILNKPFIAFIPQDDEDVFRNHISKIMSSDRPIKLELRLNNHDEKPFYVRLESMRSRNTYDGTVVIRSAMIDVTDQKIAEQKVTSLQYTLKDTIKERTEELESAKQSMEQLIKYAPTAIFEIDVFERKIVKTNDVLSRYTGYSREELIGMDPMNLLTVHSKKLYKNRLDALFSGKDISDEVEYEVVKKSGDIFFALVNITFIKKDNVIYREVIVAHDITERKKSEQSLKESEERLNLAMSVTNDGIWDWNLITDDVYYDPRYYMMAGYKVDAFPHKLKEFQKRVHPDDIDMVMNEARNHLEGEIDRFDVEFRFKHDSGEWMWIKGTGKIVEHDEHGKPIRFVGTHSDVTKRKRAEIALVRSQAKLQAALNSMTDAVFISDAEGKFIDFNDAFISFHRFENEDTIPHSLSEYPKLLEMYFPDGTVAPINMWMIPRALRGEIKSNVEYVLKRKDTGEFWTGSYSFSPIKDKNGSITGAVVVARDITDKKEAEKQLHESKESVDRILSSSLNGIYIYDIRDRVMDYINPQYTVLTGYSYDDIKKITEKNTFIEQFHHDDRKRMAQHVEEIKHLEDNEVKEIEYRFKNKNGKWQWLFSREAIFSRNENGDAEKFIGCFIDITKRRSAEESLLRSQFLLSQAEKLSHTGAWELDLKTNNLILSEEWLNIHGVDQDNLTFDELFPIAYYDDRSKIQEAFEKIRSGEKSFYDIEHRIIRQDTGQVRYVKAHGQRFDEKDGANERIYGFVQDITDQKEAERALKEREEWFRTVTNTMPQLVWTADPDGTVDFYNLRYKDYEGIEKTADGTFRWGPVLHKEDQRKTVEAWEQSIKTGEMYQVEHRVLRSDGRYHWHLSRGLPIHDDEGHICKWFGTATDIDDFKRVEQRTKKQNKKIKELYNSLLKQTRILENANNELEAFTYSASHDLQAPLRSVYGFSEILLDEYYDQLDENGKDYLVRIQKAADKLIRLVDALLEISTVHRTEIKKGPVNMSTLAEEIVLELQQKEPERNVTVDIKQDMVVNADLELMKIALNNLIDNAWKFTKNIKHAKIEFGKDTWNGHNTYFIRDNGVGFDTDFSDKLFVPFQRLHDEKEFPGTGIGLPLVARILRRHDGQIWAESKEGQGTTFYFTL